MCALFEVGAIGSDLYLLLIVGYFDQASIRVVSSYCRYLIKFAEDKYSLQKVYSFDHVLS